MVRSAEFVLYQGVADFVHMLPRRAVHQCGWAFIRFGARVLASLSEVTPPRGVDFSVEAGDKAQVVG